MSESEKDFFQGIEKDIKEIFFPYIKVASTTFTKGEKKVPEFFRSVISQMDYFKKNPKDYGVYDIEEDPLGRGVCWALVKGTGNDTVVFIHHYDVVDTEDFKLLRPYAYEPELLLKGLLEIKTSLSPEARQDLESGDYIFGRGSCDMKGGGAIQLALLKRYGDMKNFKGNVMVIAVPDEENLSYGMRGAIKLLHELKKKRGLNYAMMINSEPHQRTLPQVGIFSEGSVGKVMPFVYVRGFLAHAGKVFEGFNPVNLTSRIVAKTELNTDFCDVEGNETSPPPTCLYMKDGKTHYDVSMPLSAFACISVLTLKKTPELVLKKLREICEASFEELLAEMNQRFQWFQRSRGKAAADLPWKTSVVNFSDLYSTAVKTKGDEFIKAYQAAVEELGQDIANGRVNMLEATRQLLELVYGHVDDISPKVVIGLVPPYYPSVSNINYKGISPVAAGLSQKLTEYSRTSFGQEYVTENFFTGISDLSYSRAEKSEAVKEALEKDMPLFGKIYNIPMELLEQVSMPCINVGPWGKDFHKLTERVYATDLYDRTPRLVHQAVRIMLGWE